MEDREKYVDVVAGSKEEDSIVRKANQFKKIMAAQVGQGSEEPVSKEDERVGKEAQKIIRGLAHDRKKKEVPHELIDYTVGLAKREAINTMQYLQFERQIASHYFRKNVHLSDVELDEMITNNQIALMNQSREFHIMKAWLMFSGYLEDFVAYREVVEKGIQADLAKDRPAHAGESIDPAAKPAAPEPALALQAAANEIAERRRISMERFS